MNQTEERHRIGIGGGCHWCTEGIFQSLRGIHNVQQGWISSTGEHHTPSEAILIEFDPALLPPKKLVEIHLRTHASTVNHSLRHKYRSAIYVFSEEEKKYYQDLLQELQPSFENSLVTQVLLFNEFTLNQEEFLHYFYSKPDSAFCQSYIHPKLNLLLEEFSEAVNTEKIKELNSQYLNL